MQRKRRARIHLAFQRNSTCHFPDRCTSARRSAPALGAHALTCNVYFRGISSFLLASGSAAVLPGVLAERSVRFEGDDHPHLLLKRRLRVRPAAKHQEAVRGTECMRPTGPRGSAPPQLTTENAMPSAPSPSRASRCAMHLRTGLGGCATSAPTRPASVGLAGNLHGNDGHTRGASGRITNSLNGGAEHRTPGCRPVFPATGRSHAT